MISLKSIKPNEDNPRKIRDDKLLKLAQSITEFEKMMVLRPIVVDEQGIILGGNMRYRALVHLKYKEIPDDWVKVANGLSPDERRRFIIEDNVGFGEWDFDILRAEWDIDELADWGLDVPDIEVELEKKKATDDGYSIPSDIKTDIVKGDVIDIGKHRVVCGDSRHADIWTALMQGQIADLVMTDPPYNVDYEGGTGDKMKIENDNMSDGDFLTFITDALTMAFAHVKRGGAIYVWHADSEGLNFRNAFTAAGFDLKQCLVWVKNSMVLGRQDYQWRHEPCLYGWKPGAAHYFTDDRTNTTVIDDKLDIKKLSKAEMQQMLTEIYSEKIKNSILYHDKPSRSDEHPTMKPVPMIGDLIQNSTRPGEIVVDGFGGSGTAMVASHQLGRVCRCIELSPSFCQVHVNRMRLLQPGIEVLRNGISYNI